MSTARSKLEGLVELAKETSSDRRRELLRDITDVFLEDPGSYNSLESQHFGDIMGKVAYDLERQVREELAGKLSAEAAAPPDLIKRLAGDDIEVARPVIAQSPVLKENDLIEIANQKGQEHLFAMTARPDIGEKLSDVLVTNGDDRVVEGLVRNQTARIGRTTMEKVVERAGSNADLQGPLTDRPDLPADLMKDMLAFVTEDIRAKILDQTNQVNSEKLDELLQDVGSKLGDQAAFKKGEKSKPEIVIQKLVAAGQLNEAKLVELARQRLVPELICGLSEMAELDMPTTRRAIVDRTGEGLAIICKSCGFSQSTFSTLVNHVWPESERSIEQSCTLVALYNQVTPETAQRVIRFWRVRQAADGASTTG